MPESKQSFGISLNSEIDTNGCKATPITQEVDYLRSIVSALVLYMSMESGEFNLHSARC